MCGMATLAIVVSRICMIVAIMTPSVSRPLYLTGRAAPPPGGAACGRGGVGDASPALLARPGAAVAISVARALEHHLHIGGEAGDQFARALVVDRDAHRHALGDLHPVAVGVLG